MNRANFFILTWGICAVLFFSCKKDPDFSKGFIKYYGGINVEDASEVQQTSDGGYIIIGTTGSVGSGGTDMYVVKADAQGNKQWEKTFGGLLDDQGASIQQTSDGGYVFLGTYRYYLPGLDSNKTDIYVVKANANGDTIWTKKYGDFSGIKSNEAGVSIQQTTDAGYILAGNTDIGSDGDMVVVKLNSSGNIVLSSDQSTYPKSAAVGLDLAVNILQRPNGEYVMSSYSGSAGLNSPRVIMITSAIQTQSVAFTKDAFFETAMQTAGELTLTNDGEFVLTGKTSNDDVFLLKFKDAISNPKTWFKIFGGGGVDIGTSVQQANDGGYIVLGTTTSSGAGSRDIYLFKVDASGQNMEWSKTFGGTGVDVGKLVRKTSDGGYIILGTVEFGDDPSDTDNIMCLIKVNAKGEVGN